VVDLLGSLNVTMLPSRMRASHWPHVRPNHFAIWARPLSKSQLASGINTYVNREIMLTSTREIWLLALGTAIVEAPFVAIAVALWVH
jgi:hypothetical protein